MGKNVRDDFLKSAKDDAMRLCTLLYSGRDRPMTESLMCFGWECGPGWNDVLADLSYRLESLNYDYYDRYGMWVEAVQVKEKFGTLRFYYDIRERPCILARALSWPFHAAGRLITKLARPAKSHVVDVKPFYTERGDEVTDDYAAKVERGDEKLRDGERLEHRDGKWLKFVKVYHSGTFKYVYTRHKLLGKVRDALEYAARRIEIALYFEGSPRKDVARRCLDMAAEELIADAERKCFRRCEDCGCEIGTEDSKRVQTKGWISYICERCDADRNMEYDFMTFTDAFGDTVDADACDEYERLRNDAKTAYDLFHELDDSTDYVEPGTYDNLRKKVHECAEKARNLQKNGKKHG